MSGSIPSCIHSNMQRVKACGHSVPLSDCPPTPTLSGGHILELRCGGNAVAMQGIGKTDTSVFLHFFFFIWDSYSVVLT